MMGDARRVFKAATTKPPSVAVSSGTGRAVRLVVLVAGAGFARHRLPHSAILYCPFHCRCPLHGPPAPCSARSPHLAQLRSDAGPCTAAFARDALHLHDVADHDGDVCPGPVTTPTVMAPVRVSVMAIMARQLHRGPDCTSKQLPSEPLSVSPARRLRRHRCSRAVRLAVLAVGTAVHVRVADAGFARHRLPHFAILYCPFHRHRLCSSLRQRASHDCLQFCPHRPPLSRRGGSHPPGSPESIPLRSYPGFVVPDRVPRLWFSHPTHLRCW